MFIPVVLPKDLSVKLVDSKVSGLPTRLVWPQSSMGQWAFRPSGILQSFQPGNPEYS